MLRVPVFMLAYCMALVSSGYAPATPPKLPANFCQESYGRLTATTGECMCRAKCEGKNCQVRCFGVSPMRSDAKYTCAKHRLAKAWFGTLSQIALLGAGALGATCQKGQPAFPER
jgi:hypothetical protein